MLILFLPTGFLEFVTFFAAVAAFAVAVRFFKNSRKSLEEMFPGILTSRKLLPFGIDRSGFVIPKTTGKPIGGTFASLSLRSPSQPADDSTKEDVKELRRQLQHQQQELEKALAIISIAAQPAAHLAVARSTAFQEDTQLQKAGEHYTQQLQERLAALQDAYDELQEKVLQMENGAWESARLTIELEHAEQAQAQAENTLAKKEEKLRDLTFENQRLHEAFNELEDKFSEANLQRQQLMKKVQLLESLNADMLQMAEANRKLKTEKARVAELESMLHLMTEGRR